MKSYNLYRLKDYGQSCLCFQKVYHTPVWLLVMAAFLLVSYTGLAQEIVQGYDKSASKYAAAGQINSESFSSLKIAWTWNSPDEQVTLKNPELKTWVWESTPRRGR